MELPPTIVRELRATARRRSTYWGRAVLAALGVGACLFLFKLDASAPTPARADYAVFLVVSLMGGVIMVLIHIALILWAGAQLRREFRTQRRSRFDRFFDWCAGGLSENLKRT